ncbi:MAG: hypothetical protein ACJ8EY_11595 [Sphingomicrobium sp.]
MSISETVELLVAIALIVGAVFLYRKRGKEDPRHGSQTAVLMLAIGAIMAIHALGLLEITGLGMRG